MEKTTSKKQSIIDLEASLEILKKSESNLSILDFDDIDKLTRKVTSIIKPLGKAHAVPYKTII